MPRRLAFLAAPLALIACETTTTGLGSPRTEGGNAAAPVFEDYRGEPEVVRRSSDGIGETISGTVFVDTNRNGQQDDDERGLARVKVSNGRDVVVTDANGGYTLPARDDMSVMVVQPSGYQVPHNENWVPQFAYQHKPGGSPKPFRFGGLPDTGALPSEINFPLIKTVSQRQFHCAVLGDTQTYANQEISYFRDSTVDDILDRPKNEHPDCILAVGDVVGDDLGLIPRMTEVMSALKAPQWWVHGNHDFDFDADYDEDSADTWRRLYGPNYYAFEIGDVLFLAIDNVVYPCTKEDAVLPGREFCVERDRKRYNARITDDQMAFIQGVLDNTDEEKLVVFSHHIPFVSFVDQTATAHQTDNVKELYAMVEGRRALSLSGHTHTIENFSPGDSFEGWKTALELDALPFRHIIAGAASGGWYNGDFDIHGTPMSLQRMGGPRGWLDLEIQGNEYVDTYIGANFGRERRMWVSVNTPIFRSWYNQIMNWREQPVDQRDPVPPLSINDLPDVNVLTPRDLSRGTYITANIWNGSSDTDAQLIIGDRTLAMERTQAADGEGAKIGAEWADPFAVQRQLSVARHALESRSGIDRNQGYELFRGRSFGPQTPQPQSTVADRNLHLWRAKLPEDLPLGVHVAEVKSTDRHGRTTRDTIVIEIREQLPPARFRTEVFEAFEDGPPVR